ncbi:MAG: hypothetical protein FJ090_02290 [Deltaproteobacteria bacterium]|nr:hypothetical protein [Deltaproteobacteria bacterium]
MASTPAWVVIADLPEMPPGPVADLVEAGAAGVLVRGVAVNSGWRGAAVALASEAGRLCSSRILETAAGTIGVQSRPYLLGAVEGCRGARWARREEGERFAPVAARPVADENLGYLAVASFRALAAWESVQARWLSTAQPFDSTEWDTSGGASPEVARFALASGERVLVHAQAGSPCDGFHGEASASFMAEGNSPLRLRVDGEAPPFAAVLHDPATGGWASRDTSMIHGVVVVDLRNPGC